METSTLLLGALRQLTTVIHLATNLAVFAVALVVVRPRHRTAGTMIAVSACMLALEMFAWPAMSRLVSFLDVQVAGFYAVAFFAMALWSAAAWALLLLGLIRLAVRVQPRADAAPGGGSRP